jgi:hypothetical protein
VTPLSWRTDLSDEDQRAIRALIAEAKKEDGIAEGVTITLDEFTQS